MLTSVEVDSLISESTFCPNSPASVHKCEIYDITEGIHGSVEVLMNALIVKFNRYDDW